MHPYFKLGMDKKLIVPYAEYMKAMKPDFQFVGDTADIVDLVRCLYLPSANSVKVVGPRGSGSTVLMDALCHHQTSGFMPDDFMIRPIYKFNSNNLFSTADASTIEKRFASAMEDLQRTFSQRKVKPILIIDDGCTFADNAPQHVINGLVEAAVRADYVDLVVGVDKKKEDEFNAKHPEFVNSFTTKEIKEPDDARILAILEHQATKHAEGGILSNKEALEHIIEITQRFKGMYETAQPNRSIRLLDSSATAFRIEIHSRAPGSYETEKKLEDLDLKIASGKVEGGELESMTNDAEALRIELQTGKEEWTLHRGKIKALQEDIRKFDVMIATAQQEIDALDDGTKEAFYKDIKGMLSDVEEGDPAFKGRAKSDILNLSRDDLLKFAEFDLLVHRNPKIRELNGNISKYTEATEKKQTELTGMSDKMHQDIYMPTSIIDDIASAETKTPVGGVSGRLRDNLRNGVALMQESVFGQDHVIEPMVKSLQRAAAGLNDPDRPLGAFMIAGPPGTGKSWIGEQLAIKLFGSKEYFAVLDMENYKQDHTISALLGAPPGYSGYGKKGKLIEIAQNQPFCVLLLDEIEKAHYEVRQALLKAKGSGRLVGLDGEEADFRNIIIVETTNYGQEVWIDNDFDTAQALLMEKMRTDLTVFSPEYLDRNDAVLCAGPLGAAPLAKIVGKEISGMEKKAQRRHPELRLDVSQESIQQFVEDHCLGKSGRRSEMIVNQMIGDHLTEIMLAGAETSGTLKAQYNPDKQNFNFDFSKLPAATLGKKGPTSEFSKSGGPA